MRAAVFILLLATPALADRPECEKQGGKWAMDETGVGCKINGKRDGRWEKRSGTGQLIELRVYKAGELDGATASFDEGSCQILEKGSYATGKKTGNWASWFDDGRKNAEGPYKDDLREGTWKFYLDDVAVMEGPMVADSANGLFVEKFTTGIEWRKAEIKDGLRTTPEALACKDKGGEFNIDHKTREEGCLVEGKREGVWLGYAPEGKLALRADYVGGVESGEHIDYHPTGEILRKGKMVAGIPDGLHEFKGPTGQLFGASTITNGAGDWKAYFPDGIVSEEGSYAEGKKNGAWRRFARKGAMLEETTWRDGLREGPYREHYLTGEIQILGSYKADGRSGTWTSYYPNGKIVWLGTYDELGAASGLFYFGNFDGTVSAVGMMRANRRTGTWTLFHQTGGIAGIGTYVAGKKNGPWFEWWPTGKFWRLVTYANDREDSEPARACFARGGVWVNEDTERAIGCQVCRSTKEDDDGAIQQLRMGEWTWWHANAAVERIGSYDYGKRIDRWKQFFDNGQVMVDTMFKDDLEEGASKGFYRDGRARFGGNYVHGKEDGEWSTFHADGSIASIGSYKEGKKIGRWKYNYPGGAVKEEGEYVDGASSGAWTSYYPTGAKSSAGNYVAGKRDGVWTYWRADGSVWRTETFAAGKRVVEPVKGAGSGSSVGSGSSK